MTDNLQQMKTMLSGVLGVDDTSIGLHSNLLKDLAAESIDFIDIAFQIEQTFNIPGVKPAQIFPVFLREQSILFKDGALLPDLKEKLVTEYPFLQDQTIARFEREQIYDVFFDVSTLLEYVNYKQKLESPVLV